MEFKKYSSIENSYRTKYIENIQSYGFNHPDHLYVVTEKVHGANFSVWFDLETKEIKFAKRTAFLGEFASFYNWQSMYDDNKDKFAKVFEYFNIELGYKEIRLYGELFGGNYNHPDVKNIDVRAVQKGVDYCPYQEFYCFDVVADGKYQNYYILEELCKFCGIFYAKPLLKGTFDQCLDYPNDFQTNIPNWLGLPPIENNQCEGVVIKPIFPLFFPNGERVILKNKTEKFKEISKKSRTKNKERKEVTISSEVNELSEKASDYVNENRLRNVISKIGQVTDKDFGKVSGLFCKDVIEEFIKDYDVNSLEKSDRKQLNKLINKECAILIRENFVNIIDGVF